jgi:LAO/AO transport system kinase
MKVGERHWRRLLGQALTRQAHASVEAILANPPYTGLSGHRLGVTGHPGSGKSSLIAGFAAHRLRREHNVAVLAVDPTSPISAGSLLGDRIRMDAICDDDRLYIRSVPSGRCEDGLCQNIVGLLDTLDSAGFDDIILETVGTGQTNYSARVLVDVFMLTLVPDAGDMVQMMKAGIMELADIYIVNKADLPGAAKIAAEVRALLGSRPRAAGSTPRIVMTSSRDNRGFGELDAAVEECLEAHPRQTRDEQLRKRRVFQMKALIEQRLNDVLELAVAGAEGEVHLGAIYDRVVRMLERHALGTTTAR